jgi:putative ABC transport system permease protein
VFRSNVVFEDGAAIVPIDEGRRLTGMQVTGFSVRVRKSSPDSDAEVAAVRQHIEALRDPQDPSVRLAAQSPAEYTASISHLKVVRATSWIVSVIASLVGVIGVLNTMAMSVLERTQEIGILRAVGWPGRRVIRMILGEAVLMALAAAAVGSVTARLATELLTRFPQVNGFIEAEIAPFVFVQGFGLTLLIGLLGGLYPAIRASRLLPSEAIRHD